MHKLLFLVAHSSLIACAATTNGMKYVIQEQDDKSQAHHF